MTSYDRPKWYDAEILHVLESVKDEVGHDPDLWMDAEVEMFRDRIAILTDDKKFWIPQGARSIRTWLMQARKWTAEKKEAMRQKYSS